MSSSPPPDEQAAPSSDGPLSGRVVGGRWRVLRQIGQGGMGSVYEAQNIAIGKRVALKFVDSGPDNAEAIARFQREAQAASSVESAHIVHVFDTGTTDEGQPYLVMELLRGESLGARLRREHRLSVADAARVLEQTLRGLARAHEAGVIHRDLKPDNLFLVDRDDGSLFIKILDFGISKVLKTPAQVGPGTLTRKGVVLGTPHYMSPEQAQAAPDLDARSDLFAAGVILFECLAGRTPWSSLTSYEAVIVAICSRDAPDIRLFAPEAPAAIAEVIKRALCRDRSGRHASAGAFLSALQAAAPGVLSSRDALSSSPSLPMLASVGPPTSTSWTPSEPMAPAPVSPPPRSLPRRALLGLGAAAVAFVGTALALRGRPEAPRAVLAPPPPPEVTLRIEVTPPGATVLVDGQPLPSGLLRGPALSGYTVRVEAPGHAPAESRELLDGRPSIQIDLAPLPPASASAPPGPPPAPPRPLASGPRAPTAASASAGGLQLKVKLQ